MTPAFTTRRRAEELHSSLESGAPVSLDSRSGVEIAELTALVSELRAVAPVTPRTDFVSDLRSRLMLAAETALVPETPAEVAVRRPTTRRTGRERRVAIAVGGFAVVSATASMAVAAQSALPGDTLYSLKRVIENAQVGVQTDDDAKGSTLLSNAAGRLDEVGELSRGDHDADTITDTLDDFVTQASEASGLLLDDYAATGHASSLEELRDFTAQSMAELQQLRDVVPSEAREALRSAADLLSRIDRQALDACPSCTVVPFTELPEFSAASVPLIDDLLDVFVPPTTRTEARTDDARPAKEKAAKPDEGSGTVTTSPDDESPLLPQAPSTDGTGDGTDKPTKHTDPQNPLEHLGNALTGNGGTKDQQTSGGGLGDLLNGVDDVVGSLLGTDKGSGKKN